MADTSVRLTREGRREQLLDVASELLIELGAAALTMERLASRAGVSKAVPYLHFENANDVLVELYRRELAHFGEAVTTAMDAFDEPEDRLRAAIHAYFDVISHRRALWHLSAAGSTVPRDADGGQRIGTNFVAGIFEQEFRMPKRRALLAASILQGMLSGAVDAWAHGEASRRRAEAMACEMALHLAHTAARSD